MSKTINFKEYKVYKPDCSKKDEEIFVDKLIKCKDNCFQSFKFDGICDVNFKDIKKKILLKNFKIMD